MYLRWLHSEHIKRRIKHYSHLSSVKTGFFSHHVRDECLVEGHSGTLKATARTESCFHILWSKWYHLFCGSYLVKRTDVFTHCVCEATSSRGQSFPLPQPARWLKRAQRLWVWNKNVKHAEMWRNSERAATTPGGTRADLHHLFYTLLPAKLASLRVIT